MVSLERLREEGGFDPSDPSQAEIDDYFDRQCVFEIVRSVCAQLAEDYGRRGKGALFERLQTGLTIPTGDRDYEGWAHELGLSPDSIKVAMHRLRDRFRRAVEERVRDSVVSEEGGFPIGDGPSPPFPEPRRLAAFPVPFRCETWGAGGGWGRSGKARLDFLSNLYERIMPKGQPGRNAAGVVPSRSRKGAENAGWWPISAKWTSSRSSSWCRQGGVGSDSPRPEAGC